MYIDKQTKVRVKIAVNVSVAVVNFRQFTLIQNAPIMVNRPLGMTRKMINVLIRSFDSSGSKIMSGESLKFGDVRSMMRIMILNIMMIDVEAIAIIAVNFLLSSEVCCFSFGSILLY